MSPGRISRCAVNLLIASIVCLVAIETLPQSPPAVRDAVQPLTQRVGLAQGWSVFTPPDSLNTRLRAEITYRDGRTAEWHSPDWSRVPLWERYRTHRHEEWLDNSWGQEDEPLWRGWARYLARSQRPDLPDADRGAEVKIIALHRPIPSPDFRPWTSWRTPPRFDESETLTIEKLP